MQIIQTTTALRNALKNYPSIALVPTMGNLHAGHLQLIKTAQQHAKCVVVSIFVNPLQFGPNEDLGSYPRTFEADREMLKVAGASILFAPMVKEIYSDFDGTHVNQTMLIQPLAIANELCGASRPGHFAGVATVVLKLFNIVFFNANQPNVAVFGKKDFQQLFIIRELVKAFNLPIEMIASDTVREPGGLALSSRNSYLTPDQKIEAAELYQQLKKIMLAIQNEVIDFTKLERIAIETLAARGWMMDYIAVRAAYTLAPATPEDRHLVILAAGKLGNTRLIDNIDFLR